MKGKPFKTETWGEYAERMKSLGWQKHFALFPRTVECNACYSMVDGDIGSVWEYREIRRGKRRYVWLEWIEKRFVRLEGN